MQTLALHCVVSVHVICYGFCRSFGAKLVDKHTIVYQNHGRNGTDWARIMCGLLLGIPLLGISYSRRGMMADDDDSPAIPPGNRSWLDGKIYIQRERYIYIPLCKMWYYAHLVWGFPSSPWLLVGYIPYTMIPAYISTFPITSLDIPSYPHFNRAFNGSFAPIHG
jgi:hypothetical protein